MARGGVYAAAIAVPAYTSYSQFRALGYDQGMAMGNVMKAYLGIKHDTGQFDKDVLIQMWAPIAGWTALDWVLKKAGVWRKIGSMLRM